LTLTTVQPRCRNWQKIRSGAGLGAAVDPVQRPYDQHAELARVRVILGLP
jgi:hypothetical protein